MQISSSASGIPTIQDACYLSEALRNPTGVEVTLRKGAIDVYFNSDGDVTHLPVGSEIRVLDPNTARLFASHLKNHTDDILDALADSTDEMGVDERLENVALHLLMLIYHEFDDLPTQARNELHEELDRRGFNVPTVRDMRTPVGAFA